VLRDSRPADRQLVGELAHSARPGAEALEDLAPRAVTQSVEGHLLVSWHLR